MPQVTVDKIVEGAASLILRVNLLNDDSSGELSNHVIVSPSDCSPALPNTKPAFRIMQVWYGLVWFDVSLSFGTLQPVPIWTLARDTNNHIDFRSFGGLVDTRKIPPADENGKLTITTNGFSTLGAQGSFVIELRKLA